MLRIALIGDYNPHIKAHVAIPHALQLAAQFLKVPIESQWFSTQQLLDPQETSWKNFHGFWCTPGSPYVAVDGAFAAIQFAREHKRPFLGTCGGFQHALIEYARHELQQQAADHAESNPSAPMQLISMLSCSLVEQQGTIFLQDGSKAAQVYQTHSICETYHCNYGLNPRYRALLEEGGLVFSGVDSNQEVRIFELPAHPFFLGTLFQPERSALLQIVHPLIQAFVKNVSLSRD